MQVCAKNTCMGYGNNLKGNVDSFAKGAQDAALLAFINTVGVYSTPGGQTAFPENVDAYTSNPFENKGVLSVEVVKNNNGDNMVYDVYVARNGQYDSVALTKLEVSKSDNSVRILDRRDIALSDTPMSKNGNTGTEFLANQKLSRESNRLYNKAFNGRSETQKMTLDDIKQATGNDRCMYAYEGKFSVPGFGKYQPNVTFIIPGVNQKVMDEYDRNEVWLNPIEYKECLDAAQNLNFPFDTKDVGVIFGNYRMSKSGKYVLEVCPPEEAKHILLSFDWGGSDRTRGIGYRTGEELAKNDPDIYMFRRAASNGGGAGKDFILTNNTEEFTDAFLESQSVKEIKGNKFEFESYLHSQNEYMSQEVYKPVIKEKIDEIVKKYNELEFHDEYNVQLYDRDVRVPYHGDYPYHKVLDVLEADYEEAKHDSDAHKEVIENEKVYREQIEKLVSEHGDKIVTWQKTDHYGKTDWSFPTNFRVEFMDENGERNSESATFYFDDESVARFKEIYRRDDEKKARDAQNAIDNDFQARIREERSARYNEGVSAGLPSSYSHDNAETGNRVYGTLYLDNENRIVEPLSLDSKKTGNRLLYDSDRDFTNHGTGVQNWGQVLPGDTIVNFSRSQRSGSLNFYMQSFGSQSLSEEKKAQIHDWVWKMIDKYEPENLDFSDDFKDIVGVSGFVGYDEMIR